MSLTFSNSLKFSGIAVYSPNARYFAIAKGVEAIVYDVESLKVIQRNTFCDFIEHLEWSNDSSMLLIGLFKRGIVELKSIDHPEWICRIDEALAGITYSRWLPDNRHILTINEFNIKLTIWSLIDRSLQYINFPKFSKKGLDFTTNGHFMALLERTGGKDSIGVYVLNANIISLLTKFPIETIDAQDIKWSYDNSSLYAYDTSIECRMVIYTPTGDLTAMIEPYKNALGIRSMSISPNGHFITLGCYDQSCKIYNSVSFTNVIVYEHKETELNDAKVNYFNEEETKDFNGKVKAMYKTLKPPVILESLKPSSTEANPKIGVKQVEFSYDSNFIATRNEAMPNVIWIWEMITLSLNCVIVQLGSVTDFKWSPCDHMLIICTENSRVYYFTLENIYVRELQGGVVAAKVTWNGDGNKFILSDENGMVIGDLGKVVEYGEYQGQGQGDEGEEERNEGKYEGEEEKNNQGDGSGEGEEGYDQEQQAMDEEAFNNYNPNRE